MPDQPLLEPRFWNVKKAAAYLDVTTQTLRAWLRGRSNASISARRIPSEMIPPSRNLGNRIRIPIKEFIAWADGPFAKQKEEKS